MKIPYFRGAKHWLLLLPCLLLIMPLLVACGENSPSILNTYGPVAENESGIFYVILIIATIIFVIVEAGLIYSIIRFRDRPGAAPARQIHGHLGVEILWTVIPALVLFIVLFFTIRGLFYVADEPTDQGKPLEVEAVGHQWWWEFWYPEYKITTADTLHIPVGRIVKVHLYSYNVIHSFWVPALTGKTDVIPGHDNQKWFKADKAGTFLGICAEFCGLQHANMKFDVTADTSDTFQTWVSTQQKEAAKPTNALEEAGLSTIKTTCVGCHGIMGVDIQADQNPESICNNPAIACRHSPNLTHFGSRNLIAGGILTNNTDQCQPEQIAKFTSAQEVLEKSPCNLAKWLASPETLKPGNDMAIGTLTPKQISELVAYLENLK